MIRAGRTDKVQTMTDLAKKLGISFGRLRNTQPYTQEGHPPPISSANAKTLLWDSDQTDAFYAGQPVPDIAGDASDEDLLDRAEAAAEMGLSYSTWSRVKKEPCISEHVILVPPREEGDNGPQVEHWPRGVLRDVKAKRPNKGPGPGAGRPKGSGDMIPRDQIAGRIAELLDANPAITAAAVVDELDIAMTTAQAGLLQLRGQRMADLVEADPTLSLDAAAEQLGYPRVARRRATAAAQVEQRRRATLPYLQNVVDDLVQSGLADADEVTIQQLGDHLVAAVILRPGQPAPALVWHEQYGWRTAVSRRHPIGKVSAPEGEGIRYLSGELQPKTSVLIDALADGRRGRKRP
ncbi:hypothetical protein [Streptomyces sp. NPDC004296]|uniref:hypothetical protein n=1 Tax=Streptomyces sp. NPDC004296 TaxID=3364697 RepID=UPI0036BA6FD1